MTNGLNCSFLIYRPVGWCLGSAGHFLTKQEMIETEDIKILIQTAQKLLEQDDVNEISKNALASCLKAIRSSDHLPAGIAREIDNLIGYNLL